MDGSRLGEDEGRTKQMTPTCQSCSRSSSIWILFFHLTRGLALTNWRCLTVRVRTMVCLHAPYLMWGDGLGGLVTWSESRLGPMFGRPAGELIQSPRGHGDTAMALRKRASDGSKLTVPP